MGAEELLLESAKSAELSAAFQCLQDSEINGEPKYTPATCREIGKMIVCRTYATPIMELCHLIVAASRMGPYEYFFWDSGAARSQNFLAYCQVNPPFQETGPTVIKTPTGLVIQGERDSFTIQYSRMPVLSCLMEFLLSVLGYPDVDEIAQNLFSEDYSRKSVSKQANELSKKLYGFLKDHLPTAQSQRKFRKIIQFCQNDVSSIDDTFVLDFWRKSSLDEELKADFKTYEVAFLSIVRLLQAYNAARDLDALNKTKSIGYDMESGEISPDLLSESLNGIEETTQTLSRLESPPLNEVKFLNKLEMQQLELLLKSGNVAFRLPLSLLRAQCFAPLQSRLTQALRRKAGQAELLEIIHGREVETYSTRQISFNKLCEHLSQMSRAALQALVHNRCHEAIDLLLKISPDLDLTPLKPYLIADETSIPLHKTSLGEGFLSLLSDPDKVGDDLANLMSESQIAYKSISRKGFKEKTINREAFVEGGPLMLEILNDLETFLARLDKSDIVQNCWETQFLEDRNAFSVQFETLYGAA